MASWIDAFLPTFALIALGIVLRARVIRDGTVWQGLESLTFWVLLPALLCSSIANASLGSLPIGTLLAAAWLTLLFATLTSLAIARVLRVNRAAMTSIVQGGIRFNTYTALAIMSGLFGPSGLALAGVIAGLVVTGVQLTLTVVFVVSEGRRPSPLRMALQTVKNPLLLACLAGFAISALGGMPPGIGATFRALGAAALALGLLCVGAGLSIASLREESALQFLVTILKLALVPAAAFALGRAFGLDPLPLAMLTMITGMPTAPTAYVMARMMGGDARLMAAIITLQHIAAIVTVPLWAALLKP